MSLPDDIVYPLACPPMTDLELLAAWREGDQRAGNQLFDRHFSSLYRFFRHKMPDRMEDLVQETFLACVQGKERFNGHSSFRTYMFVAARRILQRACERLARDPAAVDLGVTSIQDVAPSPSSVLARRSQERRLLEALRSLPIDDQLAIELYYWENLTGPELAQVLGVPEPTARSRIRRALSRLKRNLAGDDTELNPDCDPQVDLEEWARALARSRS
jgi:RNA polymerase sigma factor (sigma-70 family)